MNNLQLSNIKTCYQEGLIGISEAWKLWREEKEKVEKETIGEIENILEINKIVYDKRRINT